MDQQLAKVFVSPLLMVEPPQLWIVLVGGPSWSKTPSMSPFIKAAAELDGDEESAWKETLGAYERDVEYAKARQDQWRDQVRQAVKVDSPPPAAVLEENHGTPGRQREAGCRRPRRGA
jgi:hypothetical protein